MQTNQNAETLRREADAHRQAAQDSFDRCDTDGFVSQWASGIMARLADARARLAENGGRAIFTGLYEGDRRVIAKVVQTRFGSSWMLDDAEAAKFGRKFIPLQSHNGRSRVQAQLGLSERDEWQTAAANTAGGGTGLAGACSVFVETYRTGDKWGRDAELIQEVA